MQTTETGADAAKARFGTTTGGGASAVPAATNSEETFGPFVYIDGRLAEVRFDDGYCTIDSSGRANYHYFVRDYMGSVCVVTDDEGNIEQQNAYYAWGGIYSAMSVNPALQDRKYSGKPFDRRHGLDLYDYGARRYDPALARWTSPDPLCEYYYNISPYAFCHDNPVNYIDLDGRMAVDVLSPSTHLDDEGNVITVFNDGDNGVYQHGRNADGGRPTEYMLSKRAEKHGTSCGGTKVGETEHWDEFVSPETGKTMTNYKLQLGKSFDPIISRMHFKAEDMDLIEIAMASRGGGLFDIKKDYSNVGALLNGKYATSRSAGNFLAGYNAEKGTYFGVGISFTTFQKLAGALHIEESHGKRLGKGQMIDIVIFGTYISSDKSTFKAPTWGEVMYQYRMSRAGWTYGSKNKAR